jgi:hypothetical protein
MKQPCNAGNHQYLHILVIHIGWEKESKAYKEHDGTGAL